MRTASAPPLFYTLSDMERALRQPRWRLEYVLRCDGIEPFAFAGRNRLFDQQSFDAVREGIHRLDCQREDASDDGS